MSPLSDGDLSDSNLRGANLRIANTMSYIRTRHAAWSALNRGDVPEAQALEAVADRMAQVGGVPESECDVLASSPFTIASDWYILQRDWRAEP